MLSIARTEANAENAKKSTGPRTVAGIKRSSQNSLSHGLSATSIVVIDAIEDRSEYEALLRAILIDLDAVGPVESLMAERVAQLMWRLRRVVRFETEYLSRWQFDLMPSVSALSAQLAARTNRERILGALGCLFLPEYSSLDEGTVSAIFEGCLEILNDAQREVFGALVADAALPEPCTVGLVLQFLRAAEARIPAGRNTALPFIRITPNLPAKAYEYWAGVHRQWERMSDTVQRGIQRQRTDALLLQIERAGIVERYEPRLRRDLSRTLKDLYDLQARRGRAALPGTQLARQ